MPIYEVEINGRTFEVDAPSLRAAVTAAKRMQGEPASPEGSPLRRFATNAGEMLNPVTSAQGMYQAVRHPVNTASALWDAQMQQWEQAGVAAQQGRLGEAVRRGVFGTLPLIGPVAGEAADKFDEGDFAGGTGMVVGALAPGVVGGAMRGRLAYRARRGDPAILERQAQQQVSERVLAPGNVRFKGKSQSIAPEVLRRGLRGGRAELAEAADEGMMRAGQQIDDAIQAGGGPRAQVPVRPIIARLQRQIDEMTINGEPISGAEGRVAELQARIGQLQRTAPIRARVSFEDLRRYRDEQYRLADEARAYERAGNPALSDKGFAARETGGAIRQEFAQHAPGLTTANADYTFFKTLGDVLDPAQGRPKVTTPSSGITGGAATSGAVAGGLVSPKMAFALSVVRPWIQRMRSEPAWQLASAHSKMRLAQAIRDGNLPQAQKLMARISAAGVAANVVESRTEP